MGLCSERGPGSRIVSGEEKPGGVKRDDVSLDDIRSLVRLQLGLARVGADDELVSDLGAESADVVNLVAAVEDRYGIVVGEEELPGLKTVRDLFERVWDLARSAREP